MTEEFTLEQRLREGSAVHAHEGPLLARAELMKRTRQLALPGSALAGDENRRARRRHLPRDAIHLLHGGARADETAEPFPLSLAELAPQVVGLDAQVATLQAPLDGKNERVDVDGLGHVVVGAGPHGRHSGGHVAKGRRHDDGQRGVGIAQPLGQLQAVHACHLEVGDHEIGRLLGHEPLGGFAVGGELHGVTFLHEEALET